MMNSERVLRAGQYLKLIHAQICRTFEKYLCTFALPLLFKAAFQQVNEYVCLW